MKKIVALVGFSICTSVFSAPSQDLLWQDAQEPTSLQKSAKLIGQHILKRRTLSLDEVSLKQRLFVSTLAVTSNSLAAKVIPLEIDLPLPNGKYVRVRAIESPVLSEELAASHPEIKTWRVTGVDNPSISGRIDFTSSGFHGMLVLPDGETIFIDPDKTTNNYHSLSNRDNVSFFDTNFQCATHDKSSVTPINSLSNTKSSLSSIKQLSNIKLEKLPAQELITYRLAVAGTAEYTSVFGGKTPAYNSMVTTINRVNEIYQRDLGVKLQLVSGETLLYTDPVTDPYTNNSTSALVDENMANLDSVYGNANYDIGHVFAQGISGGLAYVGVACLNQANVDNAGTIVTINGLKAGGASGLSNPQGETFSIDIIAHEIGHQLGANHTFNGINGFCAGNITAATAVEPGSGSTIMSYSGGCSTDNLQLAPDAMFHWESISQISDYTRVDAIGSSCGVRILTGNDSPVANAGSNGNIPISTPFLLEGVAVAGIATYTWDQIDAGTASAVDVDKGDNAIIRSLFPSSSPDRYIPRLSDLFAGTSTVGEILPQTVRNLNFSFAVRDSNSEIASDIKLISTENTGISFKVLSQNTDATLYTGQSINVNWDVAGTTVAPISCVNVNIQLLRVDGVVNDLLLNTSNNGSASVVIPTNTPLMTNARIMVACATQPFFQISTGKIAIQQGVDSTPPVISITGLNSLDVIKGSVYTDQGATAIDDFDGMVSVISVGTVDTAIINTYTVTYTAIDNAGNTSSITRTVNVIADTVAPIITLLGADTVTLYKDEAYVEAGATATDNIDVNVAVVTSGAVDTNTVGTYIITYSAVDSTGNVATSVIRTVNIIADTTAPVITLIGSSTINIDQNATYIESGASATDNLDSSVSVIISGAVDTSTVGSYTITYTATDNAGNTATRDRTVNVVQTSGTALKAESSGGGSMGFLLLPLMLFSLRKRFVLCFKKS